MFYKPKKHLRFILKVSFSEKEAVLTKISPILNQLSIDETSHIDDLLFSFFTSSYHSDLQRKRFTAAVYFTIWKNKSIYNHIKIKPFLFYENILKSKKESHELRGLIPTRKFIRRRVFKLSGSRGRHDLGPKVYGLRFGLLESTFWSVFSGYQFQLLNILPAFHKYRGIAHSYLHREKMLGRKINFRRKIQKQKFEDY